MALRAALVKISWGKGECAFRDIRRWAHASAQSAPLQNAIDIASPPPLISPGNEDNNINVDFPNFPFLGGFMDLMAVPKRKTSPHKRGIRNGPKALKPVPVIVRCRACGRVKLPHFFCCSGIKPNPGEQNG